MLSSNSSFADKVFGYYAEMTGGMMLYLAWLFGLRVRKL